MNGEFSTVSVLLDDAQDGWRLDRALAAAVPMMSRELVTIMQWDTEPPLTESP